MVGLDRPIGNTANDKRSGRPETTGALRSARVGSRRAFSRKAAASRRYRLGQGSVAGLRQPWRLWAGPAIAAVLIAPAIGENSKARCPDTQLVSVGDREADINEVFVWVTEKQGRPHLLVRAEQNRRVQQGHGYLWEQMAAQPLSGIKEVRLPRRATRPGRVARLEVRFAAVDLRSTRNGPQRRSVRLWALWAQDVLYPPPFFRCNSHFDQ